MMLRQASVLAAAAVLCVAFAGTAAAAELPHNDYTNPDNWLCRPGRYDACAADTTAAVVAADGKITLKDFRPDPDAPIDCFYVYPTVSLEALPNADMTPGAEEWEIARQQVARFAAKCRIYAPLYRQITLAALQAEETGDVAGVDPILGPSDVVDAWNSYIQHDNRGRGVVVIGHSQGSAILKQIVSVLVDRTPAQSHLVSAILLGTNIDVLTGKDVGGTFATIPLCHAADQTGCVIVYSSFLASHPPDRDARFGRGSRPMMSDGCVNPASLRGHGTVLDAYLPAVVGITAMTRFGTPFLKVPGFYSGACVSDGTYTYLAVSVGHDPRAAEVLPLLHTVDRDVGWGLHMLDINLALGDLVDIVGVQSKVWLAQHPGR